MVQQVRCFFSCASNNKLIPLNEKEFTPTIHHVQEAARKLPDISIWPEKTIAIAIPVSGKSQLVHFEKHRVDSTSNSMRWAYQGEALVS